MAKRRKVEYDEGTVECFYCGKPVYENSWRCPNCGKWFREGRMSVMGIVAIFVIVIILILYILQPSFVFGDENEETEKRYGILLSDVNPEWNKAEPGGYTEWGIQVTSLSNVADNFEFTSEAQPELLVTFDKEAIGLTSGKQYLNVLRVDVPTTTPLGIYDFRIYATSKSDSTANDFLDLTVEVVTLSTRTVVQSDKVKCHYTLWLEDGSQQDDSYSRGAPLSVALDSANADSTYITVIPGFSNGLLGMKTGEVKVAVVPPGQGYTNPDDPNSGHLANKTLYFQIELVSIDTA
jgi:hypothetical protein